MFQAKTAEVLWETVVNLTCGYLPAVASLTYVGPHAYLRNMTQ